MADKLKPTTLATLLWKYRDIFLRYRRQTLLGVLALVLTNLMGIAIPWQIKRAVDTIQQLFSGTLPAERAQPLWNDFSLALWTIAGLATLVLMSRVASRIFLLGAGRRIEFDIRNRLYGHLLKMPAAYYAAHPPGELMSRMTSDVDATKFLTGGGIMLGVNTVLAYVMVIPMMLVINWRLALVTFLLYPLMIRVMTGISKKVRQGYHDVQEVLAEISTTAQENLNGMMVIQSYVREAQEKNRFEEICERYLGAYSKVIRERILLYMVLAGLSGASMLIVLLVGGREVIAGELDWGGFVAYTMYLEHLAWPTMALGWTISIFQQGTAALERLDSVFTTESNIRSEVKVDDAPIHADEFSGAVSIRDLTFAYRNPYMPETSEARPVLHDINLDINPGETVALVGPVGSGKSTLLRLLPRLYEVPQGAIFLDGRDITQLPLPLLRELIVFMPQLSFLFSSTVSQNIAFGRPEILDHQEDAIVPTAETAAVHMDIQALPNRYQTLVGERGLMLSGGQRQRVALARTILMDAGLLILDDPFSNIDAETERNIVEALSERRVFHEKTTLIATHRFSLISLCDRVVLMDAGRVVALGTPDELLATQPLYQKLHRLQELRDRLGAWVPPDEKAASPAIQPFDEELDGLEARP